VNCKIKVTQAYRHRKPVRVFWQLSLLINVYTYWLYTYYKKIQEERRKQDLEA